MSAIPDRPQDAFREYLNSQVMRPIRATGTMSVIDSIDAMSMIAAQWGADAATAGDISAFATLLKAVAKTPMRNNQRNQDIISHGIAGLERVPEIYQRLAEANPELGHMRDAASSVGNTVPGIIGALRKLFEEHYPISQMEKR